jgi:hypothetical protein
VPPALQAERDLKGRAEVVSTILRSDISNQRRAFVLRVVNPLQQQGMPS